MASSAAKYANDGPAETDRPLKVSAEAGRKCVRNIHQYPILSVEWIALVDSLKQLTRLVQLEGRMPADTKVAEAQGRNKDSEGTLWDQEGHENAIRILVEEAKVNLCLRMMSDYKKWQSDPTERRSTIEQMLQQVQLTEAAVDQKCTQFEECLGLLLWRAFVHVETLQLMDIPLLIEHCSQVFEVCAKTGLESVAGHSKLQEVVVLYYVSSLMKHAEKLNNAELLAKTKEFRMVSLTTNHILRYCKELSEDQIQCAVEGLAALCDNEDFNTTWESFFLEADGKPDQVAKDNFLRLEEEVVKPILTATPDKKKDLRPLLDFFRTIQRTRK